MLWIASEMKGHSIVGSDGRVGTVSDFLFDDTSWKIRWLVVGVDHWSPGHEVLLPVSALGCPDSARRQFSVKLTIQQVRDSPVIDCDLPVSRQAEPKSTKHYDSDLIGIASVEMVHPTFLPRRRMGRTTKGRTILPDIIVHR